jgi:hypothetical protein
MHVAKRWVLTSAVGIGALVSVGLGVSQASGGSTTHTHTLHFTAVTVANANTSKHTFSGADKDVHKGKKIGTDVTQCKANKAFTKVRCEVALALRGGILYGTFNISQNDTISHGKVTGGVGRFTGATGTISGHAGKKNNTEDVTVVYTT